MSFAQTEAQWFATGSSRAIAATVCVEGRTINVRGEDGALCSVRLDAVQVSSRLGSIPRRLTLPDAGELMIADNDFVDIHINKQRKRRYWLYLVESDGRAFLLLLGMAAAVVYVLYAYGLPYGAQYAAQRVPADITQELSEGLYNNMQEEKILLASRLPQQRQERVQKLFDRVALAYDEQTGDLQLKIHRMNFGSYAGKVTDVANAFALPNGLIVVSDKLIQLLADEETTAVIAHEIGHVHHHHGMRLLLQASGVAVVVFLFFGDLSGLSLAPAVLLNAKYSRDFEREADCFAYHYLKAHHISPAVLGTGLNKLEESIKEIESATEEADAAETASAKTDTEPSPEQKIGRVIFELLSSHPDTGSRQHLAQQCSDTASD